VEAAHERRLLVRFGAAPPWRVALAVTLVYAAFVVASLARHSAGDFAFVGREFLDRGGTSATISEHATATSRAGYDGQFALFIALDPAHAAPSLDKPAYRYTHILYPAAARAVALGDDEHVPAALLVVNLLAVFAGTLALGLILRRSGESPWLASLFGFFPGVFVAVERDLGDALAYALAALGVLALTWERGRRVAIAGLVFGLAGLARETALVFPAVLGLMAMRDRPTRGAGLLALAAAPTVAWRLFLLEWLGRDQRPPGGGPLPVPLGGLLLQHPFGAATVFELLVVVVPGLLVLAAALRARPANPFVVLLVAEIVLFVLFLPKLSWDDYYAAGRLQIGAVVAALCALPALRRLPERSRKRLRLATRLAFLPAVGFALAILVGGFAPI
jgi:hypothetical protein